MKKLFLLIAILAVGSVSAQGNGDFVSFQFVKTTPGEQYNVILNEKWKELHQMRIDEGTITGWDTWWRVGATPESDWNLLIVTVFSSTSFFPQTIIIGTLARECSLIL